MQISAIFCLFAHGIPLAGWICMDVDDVRFEYPCRLMLAFAAMIHWTAAGIVWREHTLLSLEAADVLAWAGALVDALI